MGLLGLFLVLHGAPPARSDELVLGLLLMGIAGHDVWAGAKGRPPSWWLPFRRTQATEQQYTFWRWFSVSASSRCVV